MAQIDFNVLKNGDVTVESEIKKVNEQSPTGNQLVYLTEPHVACCLLVDTSGSMSGNKIAELNAALADFKKTVCEDELSAKRVDVCVIEFNTDVRVVSPFCPITQFQPPQLTAYGNTSMGKGIRYALEAVHEQVRKYHSVGVECYKPFILMITDGYPTDDVSGLGELISDRESQGRFGHLRFHAFGVQGADMERLASLSHRVMAIKNNAFKSVFNWASQSMQCISHSRTTESALGADPSDDMVPYTPGSKLPWND